jgi:hypothetical protein
MVRPAPKLTWTTALASLFIAGLLATATAAYASGSSCYGGSCEQVTGSGLYVQTTDTYANSPHCNQTLETKQYDQKGYITTYHKGPTYVSGCSTLPMPLTWDTTIYGDDNFYGQSYFGGQWQGIATVGVHS